MPSTIRTLRCSIPTLAVRAPRYGRYGADLGQGRINKPRAVCPSPIKTVTNWIQRVPACMALNTSPGSTMRTLHGSATTSASGQ